MSAVAAGKWMHSEFHQLCTDLRVHPNSTIDSLLCNHPEGITSFDVSRNFLGKTQGFAALLQLFLRHRASLRAIDLSFTPLTLENVKDLCLICKQMPNLTDLRLMNCCLGESSGVELLSLARLNRSLVAIVVENEVPTSENHIHARTKAKIAREIALHSHHSTVS